MITYPVNPDSRWTAFRISTSEAVRTGLPWPATDGGELQGASPDIAMLLEVELPKPPFDPSVERLQKNAPVYDVAANTATTSWSVVALTQAELDALADAADRLAKRSAVGGAVDTLRSWADDASNITVTNGNAVATLQTVVNRLGVFFDRFADMIEAQNMDL